MLTQKYFEAIAHYQPGAAIIDLLGELTAQAGESLYATYTTVENHQPEVIIFNFAGVDYLNSTGIALLRLAETGPYNLLYLEVVWLASLSRRVIGTGRSD